MSFFKHGFKNIGLLLVSALVFSVGLIFAASAEAAKTDVKLGLVAELFVPYALEVLYALIAFVIGWLAVKFNQLTGLKIEARHRDSLQTALKNAADYAAMRVDSKAHETTIQLKSELIAAALNYVLKSAPDAIRFFGLTPERLGELIAAKIYIPITGEVLIGDKGSPVSSDA